MRPKMGLWGLVALFLCAVLVLSSCGMEGGSDDLSVPLTEELNADADAAPQSEGSAAVALLATESRFDTPFGQSVWQAVSRFAGGQGLSHAVYKAGDSESDAQATLELAISSGAAVVVSIGRSASLACAEGSAAYPGVAFILLDMPQGQAAPLAANLRVDALATGWMAGYAAVHAGILDIGCVWQENPESQAWAFGFMRGMDDAARELDEDTIVTLRPAILLPDGDNAGLEAMLLERPRLVVAAVPQWAGVSSYIGTAYNGRVFAPQCQEDVPAGKLWALVDAEPSAAVAEALAQWREGRHDPRQEVTMDPAEGSVRLKTGLGNTSQSALDDAGKMAANPSYRRGLEDAAEAWLEPFTAGETDWLEMLPNIDLVALPGGETDDSMIASVGFPVVGDPPAPSGWEGPPPAPSVPE